MKKGKLLVQIDCDSEQALMNHYFGKSHLDSKRTSQYYIALRRFYNIFQDHGYKATLFVLGADMNSREKVCLLGKGLMSGYEVANHSFSHPQIFQNRKGFCVQKDIEMAHFSIEKTLGVKCEGFRAPNFEISSEVLGALQCLGYQYDCSVFPTPYSKIIRWIKNSGELRGEEGGYLSNCRFALCPRDAYIPDIFYPWKKRRGGSSMDLLLELPISVFPGFRIPCHASYLLALPQKLRSHLLRTLINNYAKSTLPLVYVFHLAELVEDKYLMGDEKKYYPKLEERIEFVSSFCKITERYFSCMTTAEYIRGKREGFCET